jgi:hypothetical protein
LGLLLIFEFRKIPMYSESWHRKLLAVNADAGIDEQLAVRTRQDGDVSPRALKYADIVSQLVRNDGRHGGAILD